MIKIRYCFNKSFERLPTSRSLHLGGSLFLFLKHVYEIHHEPLLRVFIYMFPHKNGTSVVITGGINNA